MVIETSNKIEPKFKCGQIVYLITDIDQYERMVVAYCVRGDKITYELALSSTTSWHESMEITEELNELTRLL